MPDVGNKLDFSNEFASRGVEIKFKIMLKVPRCDPETKMISKYFTEISERAQALLQDFIDDSVRCAVPGIDVTIQRANVPGIPASVSPNKPQGAPITVKR